MLTSWCAQDCIHTLLLAYKNSAMVTASALEAGCPFAHMQNFKLQLSSFASYSILCTSVHALHVSLSHASDFTPMQNMLCIVYGACDSGLCVTIYGLHRLWLIVLSSQAWPDPHVNGGSGKLRIQKLCQGGAGMGLSIIWKTVESIYH